MRVPAAGEAGDRDAPGIADFGVELDARVENWHFLCRALDHDGAAVETAHEVFVGDAPAGTVGRTDGGEVDGEADELVRQHGAAAEPGVAVIEVADGDTGTGADVVVGVVVEETDCASIGVALEVAA